MRSSWDYGGGWTWARERERERVREEDAMGRGFTPSSPHVMEMMFHGNDVIEKREREQDTEGKREGEVKEANY